MTEVVNTAFDNIASIFNFANNTAGVWQSFTAVNDPGFMNLIAVELYGKTPDTGEAANGLTVSVHDGVGTGGPVVAQINSVSVGPQIVPNWIRFEFPATFYVMTAGNQYTIAVSGTGAVDFLWGYTLVTPFSTYPGGSASFPPDSDLFFRVKGIDIPTNPNVPTAFPFIEVGDGTAAAPSMRFTNAPATGLYLSGANEMSLSTAGTQRLAFPPTDEVLAVGTANGTVNLGSLTNSFNELWINHMAQPFFLEGTSVPTLESTAGPFPITYVTQQIEYVIIGTMVYVQGVIEWSAATPGAGNLIILTLPDTPINNNGILTVAMQNVNFTVGSTITARTVVASLAIEFVETASGAAEVVLAAALAGGAPFNKKITFSGTYKRPFPLGP